MDNKAGVIFISRQGKDASAKADRLIRELSADGIPARGAKVPIDLMWSSPIGLNMYDMKTPSDAIASSQDGRLHSQLEAMKAKNAARFGFVIDWAEHEFNQPIIGDGIHSWQRERFENLMQSLQEEGARVVNAGPARLAKQIAALYNRSQNVARGSWHAPTPHKSLTNRYFDRSYRDHVEMLMCLPKMGEQKANLLLDTYPIMDILGITQEGLAAAYERWKGMHGVGATSLAAWQQFLLEDFSSKILREKQAANA